MGLKKDLSYYRTIIYIAFSFFNHQQNDPFELACNFCNHPLTDFGTKSGQIFIGNKQEHFTVRLVRCNYCKSDNQMCWDKHN